MCSRRPTRHWSPPSRPVTCPSSRARPSAPRTWATATCSWPPCSGPCWLLEYLGGLLSRSGVELDQEVDDDPVVVVLVEADVGEELAGAVVAEGGVGEGVAGLGTRARLDVVGVDGDRA